MFNKWFSDIFKMATHKNKKSQQIKEKDQMRSLSVIFLSYY